MRLNQITAPATDLAASIAFYERLGLRLIVRTDAYARFQLPEGDSTFSLHVTADEVARAGAPQIYFECDDLDAEVARLAALGVVFESGPEDRSWLWREAWTRDPAGNSLCLFRAGAARLFPPWRLSAGLKTGDFHLVILSDERLLLARRPGAEWRDLQAEFEAYVTSLGPFNLAGVLAMLVDEWPDELRAHEDAIRAFAAGDAGMLEL